MPLVNKRQEYLKQTYPLLPVTLCTLTIQTVGCFYEPPDLTMQNSTHCPHSVFMRLVCLFQDSVFTAQYELSL